MGWIITGVGLGLIFAKIQRQIDPCVNIEAELDKNIDFKFLTQLNTGCPKKTLPVFSLFGENSTSKFGINDSTNG